MSRLWRSARVAARSRGFTLTELMVVVAMVGVLATIGVASFKKQAQASKSNEAASVIQAIRGAEEAFRAEHQQYLDVSVSGQWYPSNTYGQTAYTFQTDAAHADLAAWNLLNPRVTRLVQFRYRVNAGAPGKVLPALRISSPGWPDPPTEPWYVIQARADFDNNGVFCNAVAASFNSELYIENEGE